MFLKIVLQVVQCTCSPTLQVRVRKIFSDLRRGCRTLCTVASVWVAVKEFQLSYHIPETMLFTKDPTREIQINFLIDSRPVVALFLRQTFSSFFAATWHRIRARQSVGCGPDGRDLRLLS